MEKSINHQKMTTKYFENYLFCCNAQLLCILSSKWVLQIPLAGGNHLFGYLPIFSNRKKGENCPQKGEIQELRVF